jgi:hypothetical protein
VLTDHVVRNIADQRKLHLNGNFGPDSHQWQPGLLANLQEARAAKQLLIMRNIGHDSIVGETTRKIKAWIRTAPICRYLRFIFYLHRDAASRSKGIAGVFGCALTHGRSRPPSASQASVPFSGSISSLVWEKSYGDPVRGHSGGTTKYSML